MHLSALLLRPHPLAWPEDGAAVVRSLGSDTGRVSRVELLGRPGPLDFAQEAAGLRVQLPSGKPCDHAFALKVTGLDLK